MAKLRCIALALSALGAATARAEFVPVTLAEYGTTGQTMLWRADLSGVGTIQSVTITDRNLQGGSSGVFSGFDLDFLILDRDGDLTTVEDRILPFQDARTYVVPGVVRKGLNSIYKPTTLYHPGPLFGLNANGSVDFATASLNEANATFHAGVPALTVDTSNGWVSLGDGGEIHVAFPLVSAAGGSLFLFLGDVGIRDEMPSPQIELVVGDTTVPLFGPGARSSYPLAPGETINIDARPEEMPTGNAIWQWDLDDDGEFDDGTGPILGISYGYLMALGVDLLHPHTIWVRPVVDGVPQPFPTSLAVPEPVTLALFAAAAGPLLLLRRRR